MVEKMMKISIKNNGIAAKGSLLLSILTMTACANSLSMQKDVESESPENLAKIYQWEVKNNTIWFLTRSTGCTNEKHFKLITESSPSKTDKTFLVSIVRIKQDFCKAMPRTVAFELPLPELEQRHQQVVVTNPLAEAPKKASR